MTGSNKIKPVQNGIERFHRWENVGKLRRLKFTQHHTLLQIYFCETTKEIYLCNSSIFWRIFQFFPLSFHQSYQRFPKASRFQTSQWKWRHRFHTLLKPDRAKTMAVLYIRRNDSHFTWELRVSSLHFVVTPGEEREERSRWNPFENFISMEINYKTSPKAGTSYCFTLPLYA